VEADVGRLSDEVTRATTEDFPSTTSRSGLRRGKGCQSRADYRTASMNDVFSMILRYWLVASS
jgi:hypothetical protein